MLFFLCSSLLFLEIYGVLEYFSRIGRDCGYAHLYGLVIMATLV